MTDRELMQMALDALDIFYDEYGWGEKQQKAHEALRARLAQPEPEPVAWMHDSHVGFNVPLYTAPPQRQQRTYTLRKWVGLTDDEIKEIVGPWGGEPIKGYTRELINKIEAKLKEKNT